MAGSEQYYQVLGLQSGATPEEIKRAYRDLALVWHPDRFGNAPHLREMAEQKMREINIAYAYLQADANSRDTFATNSKPASTTDSDGRYAGRSQRARPTGGAVIQPEWTWHGPGNVACTALSPDGQTAWAGGTGLRAWDSTTGAERREYRIEKGDITALCASPCGRYLCYGYCVTVLGAAERREARICELVTGRERLRLKGLRGRLTAADFSSTGDEIVTGDSSGGLGLWESATGRQIRQLPVTEQGGVVHRAGFCAGNSRVVSLRLGELQEQIALWDAKSGALIREFTTHVRDSRRYAQIQDVSPTSDGQSLLVANNDPLRRAWSLHLWDMTTDREIRSFDGHEGRIMQVVCATNGRWAVSGSEDKTVRLWELASGTELCRLSGVVRTVMTVSFAADSRSVLGTGSDGKIYLWRLPVALQQRIGMS